MAEFGKLRPRRSFLEGVQYVRYLLREEDHIHVRPDTVKYHINAMVQSGSLREENLRKGLRPGSDEIDAGIVDEFKILRRGNLAKRVKELKEQLEKKGIETTEAALRGRIKSMVAKGILDERNLGKQAPPSDRELEERAKRIEVHARDPENNFSISDIVKATGLSRASVQTAITQRVAPGWAPSTYMEYLMLERLWRTRGEHEMKPNLMGEHVKRTPKVLKRYGEHLTTAEELAALLAEHGKPIEVGSMLKKWHTYSPIVYSAHGKGRKGQIKILKQHRVI